MPSAVLRTISETRAERIQCVPYTVYMDFSPHPHPQHRLPRGDFMTGTLLAQLADVSTTLFCTTGLALMGWIFFGKLLTPTPRGVHISIHSQGDGETLEQSIRSLIWLRSMGLLTCPIFIVDGGLSPQGLALAQRLCDRWDNVALQCIPCHPERSEGSF